MKLFFDTWKKNFHAWKKTPCEPFNVPRVLKTCPKVIRMAIIARSQLTSISGVQVKKRFFRRRKKLKIVWNSFCCLFQNVGLVRI